MPAGGFSVGRDVSLTVIYNGAPLTFGLVTNFEAKPITGDNKILGLDGVPRHQVFPEGWSGSFTLTREDASTDDWWASLEAAYFAGQNIPYGTILESITEADGSLSQYRFENVSLKLTDAGSWSGNKEVIQKVEFMASKRKAI